MTGVKRAELRRDFFLNLDKSGQGFLFYDISQSGLHHHHFRKTQGVTERHIRGIGGSPTGMAAGAWTNRRGKVTRYGRFAIRHRADIMADYKIIVLF